MDMSVPFGWLFRNDPEDMVLQRVLVKMWYPGLERVSAFGWC